MSKVIKTPFGETQWLTVHHAAPLVNLCFLLSPCYLQDPMPCQWSVSDFLSWVLRIWESVFYSQAFFTLHSFLLVSRPPWDRQFNTNISRVSFWYFRNIAPAQLFFWITTIHNKIYWSFVCKGYGRVAMKHRMSLMRFDLFSR